MKSKVCKELFWSMFKLGALTFGGGYAMTPLIIREFSERHDWMTHEEIVDVLAVSQSLPGAIAINASIMGGYKLARLRGALYAAVGVILPSLIVLSVVSYFYIQFKENAIVFAALTGLRAGVVALMIKSLLQLGKPCLKSAATWIIAVLHLLQPCSLESTVCLLYSWLRSRALFWGG